MRSTSRRASLSVSMHFGAIGMLLTMLLWLVAYHGDDLKHAVERAFWPAMTAFVRASSRNAGTKAGMAAWKGRSTVGGSPVRRDSHSSRRAAHGSSSAALRAGRKLAANATASSSAAAPPIVSGSYAFTP